MSAQEPVLGQEAAVPLRVVAPLLYGLTNIYRRKVYPAYTYTQPCPPRLRLANAC